MVTSKEAGGCVENDTMEDFQDGVVIHLNECGSTHLCIQHGFQEGRQCKYDGWDLTHSHIYTPLPTIPTPCMEQLCSCFRKSRFSSK